MERTAAFVAANGDGVLPVLQRQQGQRLAFLVPSSPLHAYLLFMIHAIRAGR